MTNLKLDCNCVIEYGDDIPTDIIVSEQDDRNVLTNSLDESVFEDEWRDLKNIIPVKVKNQELTHLRAGVKVESWFGEGEDGNGEDVGYIKDIDGNLVIRSSFRVIPKEAGVEANVSKVIYKCKEHREKTDADLIKELHKPRTPKPQVPLLQRIIELNEKDNLTLEELNELRRLEKGL